jgi:hypothetical protein
MMNIEKKLEHIEVWKKSGKSKAEDCRANQISYQAFLKWISRYDENAESFKEVKILEDEEINSFGLYHIAFR